MPQVPPKKPKPQKAHVRLPPTHRARPVEEETAGKLYLVRDKDEGDGQPELWGKDMPYADACILKEQVVGRGKSRSARVEIQEMSPYLQLPVSPRSPRYRAALSGEPQSYDPDIAEVQRAALAAARPVAVAATQRAAAPAVTIPPQLAKAMTPPAMPELPAELEGEDLPDGIDADELEKILTAGDLPSADDLEAAAAEVEANPPPVNILELAMTVACPHVFPGGNACGAAAAAPCTDPSGPITHPARIEAAAKAKATPYLNDPLLESGHA